MQTGRHNQENFIMRLFLYQKTLPIPVNFLRTFHTHICGLSNTHELKKLFGYLKI